MEDRREEWFIKIKACIDSCTDTTHFKAIEVMLEMFNAMYNDDNLDFQLKDMRNVKYNDLHAIVH